MYYSAGASQRFRFLLFVFFFKQKTAYEMRISDWSSDVCSSDLLGRVDDLGESAGAQQRAIGRRRAGGAGAGEVDAERQHRVGAGVDLCVGAKIQAVVVERGLVALERLEVQDVRQARVGATGRRRGRAVVCPVLGVELMSKLEERA